MNRKQWHPLPFFQPDRYNRNLKNLLLVAQWGKPFRFKKTLGVMREIKNELPSTRIFLRSLFFLLKNFRDPSLLNFIFIIG
jgi:hypothetical protein